MINKFSLDHQSQNYLIISSDIESRYEMVITKLGEYFDKSVEKILENPDVMYVSLPVIDKSGNIISTLSNYELQMREYGLLDKLDTSGSLKPDLLRSSSFKSPANSIARLSIFVIFLATNFKATAL